MFDSELRAFNTRLVDRLDTISDPVRLFVLVSIPENNLVLSVEVVRVSIFLSKELQHLVKGKLGRVLPPSH
jgi:hypothetical protein